MQKRWSDGLIIRSPSIEDVSPIVELEREQSSAWNESMLQTELAQQHGFQLVACLAERVVGWCCCRFVADEAELLKIAVMKTQRRRGIALRLLEILEEELQKVCVCRLFLEVRSKNRPALGFYLAVGFTEINRRIRYYNQPEDDALIMSKSIT